MPDTTIDTLLVKAQGRICALRLTDVIETLRPLEIQPMASAPRFVRGAAVVRGRATPVVSLARLFGGADETGARWVSLRAGVALEVDEVVGLHGFAPGDLAAAAPLLGDALREHAEALAVLDGQLVAVIRAARLLPDREVNR